MTTQEILDKIENVVNRHETNFTIVKTIEELNELSTALAQYLTKPISVSNEEHIDNIIKEVADVEILLCALKYKLGINLEVYDKIPEKINKFDEYVKKHRDNFGKLRKEL